MAGEESPAERIETARVVEVWRGRAIVELPAPPGGNSGAAEEFRAAVPRELKLQPGDRVELRLRPARRGRAAIAVYSLPLAAFLGAALAAHRLWGSEAVTIACAFGALAGGFLALIAYERRHGPRSTIGRRL